MIIRYFVSFVGSLSYGGQSERGSCILEREPILDNDDLRELQEYIQDNIYTEGSILIVSLTILGNKEDSK